jgi:hypothetical protein
MPQPPQARRQEQRQARRLRLFVRVPEQIPLRGLPLFLL